MGWMEAVTMGKRGRRTGLRDGMEAYLTLGTLEELLRSSPRPRLCPEAAAVPAPGVKLGHNVRILLSWRHGRVRARANLL